VTRILVVEDNADLAFALTSTLETEGYEVHVAGTGPDAVARTEACRPDLVILDVMLPGFDGFRVLRTLREGGAGPAATGTPVLLLTARGAEEDKVRGFRVGADDYVTKPFGAMELLARVDALLRRTQRRAAPELPTVPSGVSSARRDSAGPPEAPRRPDGPGHPIIRFADVEVNRATRVVRRAGELVALTPKEYDLLVALVDRDGAVAPRHELLREVWGYRDEVSSRTVDIHVAELRRKLEPRPAEPRHILTTWKVGYRFER
jgi:DNA-binding response OmpR family regulator